MIATFIFYVHFIVWFMQCFSKILIVIYIAMSSKIYAIYVQGFVKYYSMYTVSWSINMHALILYLNIKIHFNFIQIL